MDSKFGSVGSCLLFDLGHFVQVLIHRGIGFDLGSLIALQVVGAVRVDLHLRLPILGLRKILLQLDTNEFPLLSLLGDLGGRHILHDLLEVGIFI